MIRDVEQLSAQSSCWIVNGMQPQCQQMSSLTRSSYF